MRIQFYYQIDFIDEAGLANYIDTFEQDELKEAKEHYQILTNALCCVKETNNNAHYVLDMYAYIEGEDTDTDTDIDSNVDVDTDIEEDTDVLVAQILPEFKIMEVKNE